MSPYFCWSLLSLSLKTGGMKSERRRSSAMMAFPLETILRMAWPHWLLSARKSTMVVGEEMKINLDTVYLFFCIQFCKESYRGKQKISILKKNCCLLFISNITYFILPAKKSCLSRKLKVFLHHFTFSNLLYLLHASAIVSLIVFDFIDKAH